MVKHSINIKLENVYVCLLIIKASIKAIKA